MLLAWVSMRMSDDHAGVRLLERAQQMAGVGADLEVDRRLNEMHQELKQMQENEDSNWDNLAEGDEFISLWKKPEGFSIPPRDYECLGMLEPVVHKWGDLEQRFGPSPLWSSAE
jgi:hypothetical protein